MTVTNENRNVVYLGNGVTTEFPFEFPVFSEEDIEIRLVLDGELTSTEDFTVELNNGGVNGGTVTYTGDVLTSDDKIIIVRTLAATQDTSITNQTRFFPNVIENTFDRIVLLVQQALEESGRAIKVTPTVAGVPNQEFVPELDGLLTFDSDGNAIIGYKVPDIETLVNASIVAAAASIASAESAELSADRAERAAEVEILDVRLFGAKGDGVTNDSPAIQEALEYVFSQPHANLHFPAGRFLFEQQVSVEVGGDEREISITGVGQASQLFSANGDGCIKIESTNRRHRVELRNISIIPCINNAGSPFQFTQPEGGIDNRRNAVVENVYLSRLVANTITTFEPDIEKHTWSNGISLEGTNRPYVSNMIMHEQPNSREYITPKPQYLLNLDGCYNPTVLFSLLVGPAARGITNVRTGSNEGGRYHGTNVVGQDWPLYIDQPERHPVVTLVNTHLNGVVGNLYIRNCKFIDIVGCWFYNARENPSGQVEFIDVEMDNCEHINSEILFRGSTNTARRHYKMVECRDFDLNLTKRLASRVQDTSVVQIDGNCRDGIIRLPDDQASYDFKGYDQAFTAVAPEAVNIKVVTPETRTDSDFVSSNWTARKQTTGSPRISRQAYTGRNDGGQLVRYVELESYAAGNTEGSERGRFDISARVEGELTVLARVLNSATSSGAALEVAVRESGVQVLRRVRVGPNGSGPGGTGRALYVDDTV